MKSLYCDPPSTQNIFQKGNSMSAVTAPLGSVAHVSIHQKLNSVWHRPALKLFMVVVLAHWAEHLAQAYQVYALHWPRPQAGGVLGLFFPWLVSTEVMHYGYALVMLVGLWTLRSGF